MWSYLYIPVIFWEEGLEETHCGDLAVVNSPDWRTSDSSNSSDSEM